MASKIIVDDFISQKKFAVVGVSRNSQKFGNAVFRELKAKDYSVFPINPNALEINGEKCYANLSQLPEQVDGVILTIPHAKTLPVVREAYKLGINRIWFQNGSVSEDSIKYCDENGMKYVKGECILMFAEPVGAFHKVHRFIWKMFGKLPK
ncbi:MAG: CoA-binding protein [bacterium]